MGVAVEAGGAAVAVGGTGITLGNMGVGGSAALAQPAVRIRTIVTTMAVFKTDVFFLHMFGVECATRFHSTLSILRTTGLKPSVQQAMATPVWFTHGVKLPPLMMATISLDIRPSPGTELFDRHRTRAIRGELLPFGQVGARSQMPGFTLLPCTPQ